METKRQAKAQRKAAPPPPAIKCATCGKTLRRNRPGYLYPAVNTAAGIGVCSERCHRATLGLPPGLTPVRDNAPAYTDLPPRRVHHGSRDVSDLVGLKRTPRGKVFAVVNIGGFMRAGSLPEDVLDAADAAAMRALDAAPKARGAEKTNAVKRARAGVHRDSIRARVDALTLEGRAKRQHHRDARAAAVKQVARENAVTPERVRRILRSQ